MYRSEYPRLPLRLSPTLESGTTPRRGVARMGCRQTITVRMGRWGEVWRSTRGPHCILNRHRPRSETCFFFYVGALWQRRSRRCRPRAGGVSARLVRLPAASTSWHATAGTARNVQGAGSDPLVPVELDSPFLPAHHLMTACAGVDLRLCFLRALRRRACVPSAPAAVHGLAAEDWRGEPARGGQVESLRGLLPRSAPHFPACTRGAQPPSLSRQSTCS